MGRIADTLTNKKVVFVSDSFFALVSKVTPKIASTLLFILLLNRQGATVAGAFSLSIAYLTAAVMLSSIGLDDLVVREVAMHPALSRRYLVNSFVLRFLCAIIGYGILFVLVTWVFHYDPSVDRIILIMGLSILPEGFLATLFSVFNGNKKLNWMALVSICGSFFQLIAGAVALWLGAQLEVLIVILIAGTCLGVIISLILFKRLADQLHPIDAKLTSAPSWRPDWDACKVLLVKTIPFSIIISITSLDAQIDVLLLSAFNNLAAVGVYSAARTIIQLLVLIPSAVRMVIYPYLSYAYANAQGEVSRIYNQSWKYLALIGIPVSLGGIILARPILNLVYHQNASPVMALALSILMLDLLVNFIFQPSARVMVVSNHQSLLSLLLALSVGFTVLLSFLLVPRFGLIGTSIARTVSSWLYFISVEIYVFRIVLPHNQGVRQAMKPLLAGIVMMAIVWLLKSWTIYLTIPLGVVVYTAIIFILMRPSRLLTQHQGISGSKGT